MKKRQNTTTTKPQNSRFHFTLSVTYYRMTTDHSTIEKTTSQSEPIRRRMRRRMRPHNHHHHDHHRQQQQQRTRNRRNYTKSASTGFAKICIIVYFCYCCWCCCCSINGGGGGSSQFLQSTTATTTFLYVSAFSPTIVTDIVLQHVVDVGVGGVRSLPSLLPSSLADAAVPHASPSLSSISSSSSSSSCSSSQTLSSMMFVLDPVIHFGTGAVAGAVGAVAAYPFDYVKSQLQTPYGKQRWGRRKKKHRRRQKHRPEEESKKDQITYSTDDDDDDDDVYDGGGGIQCAIDTFTEYGPQRFYKGVTVQVLGIAPEKGIKLGVNDVLKELANSNFDGTFPFWAQVLAGGTAGFCQVLASSPLEVMKVGLQTSNKTIEQVWTDVGGFSGLFRGAEACIVRDVLFTAVCFPFYTYLVEQYAMNTFVAGAISGVISSFIATPPDVVKTRILNQGERTSDDLVPLLIDAPAAIGVNGESPSPVMATTAVVVGVSAYSDDSESFAGSFRATNSSSISPWTDVYSTQDYINIGRQEENGQHQQLTTSESISGTDTATTNDETKQNKLDNQVRRFWPVLTTIVQAEEASVLFSGVTERCVGAVPRFGATLGVHDYLEHAIDKAGWFTHV